MATHLTRLAAPCDECWLWCMTDWQLIEISTHGKIVVLRPVSDEGRQWFEDKVWEPEPGGIYTREPCMAQDILRAASRDLLSMQ